MPRTLSELALEESVLRDPYNPQQWLLYTSSLSPPQSFVIYERGVAAIPGSYKLWRAYSHAFQAYAKDHHPLHTSRKVALEVSRRAAEALKYAPVLWCEYIEQCASRGRWAEARKGIDSALRTLPILQHDMIWKVALETVVYNENTPRMLRVMLIERYATLRIEERRRVYKVMLDVGMWDRALEEMKHFLEEEGVWEEVRKVATKHAGEIKVDVEGMLRDGIKQGVDVGEMWVALGEYFIRRGMVDKARDVFEEAMTKVNVVREFVLVFEAYSKMEEGLAEAGLRQVENGVDIEELVEESLKRLEGLMNRRVMLMSDVKLRQNVHNVHEWHRRVRMFKQVGDSFHVVDTYTKAVMSVNAFKATQGRWFTLWVAFSKYYEEMGEKLSARQVWEKAVSDVEAYPKWEDLAAVWCEWAEMELRWGEVERAREVLKRGTKEPEEVKRERALRMKRKANRVGVIEHEYDKGPAWSYYRSRRLWSLRIDVEQSFGNVEEVAEVHERMLEYGITTASIILNGGAYLEGLRRFERAFRLYESAVRVLQWPEAVKVWVVYLTKFVERFGGSKLERTRDLFEEVIRAVPKVKKGAIKEAHPQLRVLYLMYVDMEEKYSLARHAVAVLARAVKEVREKDRGDLYRLYIVKVAGWFGVTKTRAIYEEAMSSMLDVEEVLDFAMRYAEMEARVGEVDRARAIFGFASGIADPRRAGRYEIFWDKWNEFELQYGTEDSFGDMLKVKRRVALDHRGVLVEEAVDGVRNMVRDEEASKEMSERASRAEMENGNSNLKEDGENSINARQGVAKEDGYEMEAGIKETSILPTAHSKDKEREGQDENREKGRISGQKTKIDINERAEGAGDKTSLNQESGGLQRLLAAAYASKQEATDRSNPE